MKIRMTMDEIRRPLGSGLCPEARYLAERINTGDYNDEGWGVPEGGPIDWNALNQAGAENDRARIATGPKARR